MMMQTNKSKCSTSRSCIVCQFDELRLDGPELRSRFYKRELLRLTYYEAANKSQRIVFGLNSIIERISESTWLVQLLLHNCCAMEVQHNSIVHSVITVTKYIWRCILCYHWQYKIWTQSPQFNCFNMIYLPQFRSALGARQYLARVRVWHRPDCDYRGDSLIGRCAAQFEHQHIMKTTKISWVSLFSFTDSWWRRAHCSYSRVSIIGFFCFNNLTCSE